MLTRLIDLYRRTGADVPFETLALARNRDGGLVLAGLR